MSKLPERHFKTHADLKNIIGQDLINDDDIAIVELVKNGIDAGAGKVTIEFSKDKSAIFIEDNGSGMSEFDIDNKWLNIAYSEKKHSVHTGRVLAGNKGVGRFACDRLGRKLNMFTRTDNGKLLHLVVDWTAFEGQVDLESIIQNVDVDLSETTNATVEKEFHKVPPKHGTLLVITDLRQSWDRDKLLHLKRSLERFVNPIAVFDKRSVEIELISNTEIETDATEHSYNKINGRVENQVFSKLKFNTTYIESIIDESGKTITTELHHDGNRIYKLVEENIAFPLLKNVHVVVHYMNTYKKAYFKRQTGLHLIDFGSIFLFINGYRVPPYGDKNNDWLQLDVRKGQGTSRYLGTREVLGRIEIRDTDSSFRIVSNREGVARNEHFSQLTNRPDGLFIQTLGRFERFVVDGLKWDSVPEHIRSKLKTGVVPGDKEMPELEVYDESVDSKRRRIAIDVLRIVGASPAHTLELEISPDVLDALSREREEQVNTILDKFEAYGSAVGQDVKLALKKVHAEFYRQKSELEIARKDASRKDRQVDRIKKVAREISQEKKELQIEFKTQQTELLFSRLASGTDQDHLMLLHHQSGIYANTAKNFLDKALGQLQSGGDPEKLFQALEKALINTRKIIAVTSFATKANFKLNTETITADIATFIQEYLENVARDKTAQNLIVSVTRSFEKPFVMRFKPIDVAIVFDNLASNSTRARAKRFYVDMKSLTENELTIQVWDDGPGLTSDVKPPEKVFDRGVTTTRGSGLGLYHVSQTVKNLNGDISLDSSVPSGFGLLIRLMK